MTEVSPRQVTVGRILESNGVSPSALIGSGGESSVFALDDHNVLRIYGNNVEREYLHALSSFYSSLDRTATPLEIPTVISTHSINGVPFSIEKRIAGESLEQHMTTLVGEDRERTLRSYARAVGDIQLLG